MRKNTIPFHPQNYPISLHFFISVTGQMILTFFLPLARMNIRPFQFLLPFLPTIDAASGPRKCMIHAPITKSWLLGCYHFAITRELHCFLLQKMQVDEQYKCKTTSIIVIIQNQKVLIWKLSILLKAIL